MTTLSSSSKFVAAPPPEFTPPVPYDEEAVRTWVSLCPIQRGADNFGWTPMNYACCMGELNVFKWFYDRGEAKDISYVNKCNGTPMRDSLVKGGKDPKLYTNPSSPF